MGEFLTRPTDHFRIAPGQEFPDAAYELLGELLLQKRGFDLGKYKDRCLKRRIAARLKRSGCAGASAYLNLLHTDETELDALLRTLTIHVTQFFRNPSTFRVLEHQVLPALIQRAIRLGRSTIRLCSFGCATGEEAYSLALTTQKQNAEGRTFIIEGMDISEGVLEKARDGLYHPMRLKEVSQALLKRAFTAEDGGFRLNKDIRQGVRFRHRDLLDDAPLPAADLILCRNILIYFSKAEQDRLLHRISESLCPGGYLVLGRAETLMAEARTLFVPEFPVERIYRCL